MPNKFHLSIYLFFFISNGGYRNDTMYSMCSSQRGSQDEHLNYVKLYNTTLSAATNCAGASSIGLKRRQTGTSILLLAACKYIRVLRVAAIWTPLFIVRKYALDEKSQHLVYPAVIGNVMFLGWFV